MMSQALDPFRWSDVFLGPSTPLDFVLSIDAFWPSTDVHMTYSEPLCTHTAFQTGGKSSQAQESTQPLFPLALQDIGILQHARDIELEILAVLCGIGINATPYGHEIRSD